MTYLSRLDVNALDRRVQRELGDCDLLHRRILNGFPHVEGSGREALGVLYRVDVGATGIALLVQSATEPDWSALPPWFLSPRARPNVACKPIDEALKSIRAGQTLRFRLHANPTKRVAKAEDRLRGKRVDLRREEDQLAWLERKAVAAGFETVRVAARPPQPDRDQVPDVRTTDLGRIGGRRRRGQESDRLTLGSVTFEGELRVTDANLLCTAIRAGIGSGKAYGCGLLSVAVG
jgi:CRISPR system Cascade subunit CasE